MKKLILRIQEVFFQKLQAKTSWGKNEIITLYQHSVTQVLLENLDNPIQDEPDPDAGKDVDSNTPNDIM